jgi:hypothetical protein
LLLRYGSCIGLTEIRIEIDQYLFRCQGMVVACFAAVVALSRRVCRGANWIPFATSCAAAINTLMFIANFPEATGRSAIGGFQMLDGGVENRVSATNVDTGADCLKSVAVERA